MRILLTSGPAYGLACQPAGAALALTPEEFSAQAVVAAASIQAEIDAMPHAGTVLTTPQRRSRDCTNDSPPCRC